MGSSPIPQTTVSTNNEKTLGTAVGNSPASNPVESATPARLVNGLMPPPNANQASRPGLRRAPPKAQPVQQQARNQQKKGNPAIGSSAWIRQCYSKLLEDALGNQAPSSPPHYNLPAARPAPVVQPDRVNVSIAPDARVVWEPSITEDLKPLSIDDRGGISSQLHSGKWTSNGYLTIGLDFGTSSVKVVVTDYWKQSFAIPFRDAVGINAYLLPSRLYETDGSFSLNPEGQLLDGVVHRDLKLALMENPGDLLVRNYVIAFLSLVIRKVRAWFFAAHGDAYRNADILWTLVIGVPADVADQAGLLGLYASLGKTAWYVAGREEPVSLTLCEQGKLAVIEGVLGDEIDVQVIPELAAQIQGFRTSDQFDPKAGNLYLIADVGAGTVDSCLLRVEKTLSGSFSLHLYTTMVETRGVMNLHRHRMTWWLNKLPGVKNGEELVDTISTFQVPTDQLKAIPEKFDGYFEGVEVSFSGNEVSPDDDFREGLLQQVQGGTAYRAYREGKLVKSQVSVARSILCGGGARMEYYKELSRRLGENPHGFPWLAMRPMSLVLPRHLRAEGVADKDFDRLSVAYGLSTLQMESLKKMLPQPKMQQVDESCSNWWSAYVDKDQI